MSDFLSFRLSDDFVAQYENREVPWGFKTASGDSFSELVFISKYSRTKADGTKERWHEVCRRVVEGTHSILKDHVLERKTHWNGNKAQRSAEEMYDRMFNFKWTPPGRGLFCMGTELVNGERDAAALYNCASADFAHLNRRDPGKPFGRVLEMSMYGIGVGYTTQVDKEIPIQPRDGEPTTFVIPDTREGWGEAVRVLVNSYLIPDRGRVIFDYSEIRPFGAPLKRFGGVASGPEPLRKSITQIEEILDSRVGENFCSTDVVDICNLVAKAAIAGGKRRAALLSLGDLDDEAWMSYKDYTLGHKRTGHDGWAWMSNNSVSATEDGNFSSIIPGVLLNGEPGMLFLDTARKYGRLEDGITESDTKVTLSNPCLTGDTLIAVADGRGHVPIAELAAAGDDVPVYTLNNHGGVSVRTMRNPRVTGFDEDILRVTFDDGSHIDTTTNHKLVLLDGSQKQVRDLEAGDAVTTMTRQLMTYTDAGVPRNSHSGKYWWLNTSHSDSWRLEHRTMADHYVDGGIPKGWVVHHADFNSENNAPDNLVPMPRDYHTELHAAKMRGVNNPVRGFAGEFGQEWIDNYRAKQSAVNAGQGNSRYIDASADIILEAMQELTASLGYKPSNKDWQQYAKEVGLPTQFSAWRKEQMGGTVDECLRRVAEEMGHPSHDPRRSRYADKLRAMGYNVDDSGSGKPKVEKTCEVCGTKFWTSRRESSYCSHECVSFVRAKVNAGRDYSLNAAGIKNSWEAKHVDVRRSQVDVFLDLRLELGRDPLKKEWAQACKNMGISAEISRQSSPFTSWEELKSAALVRNHRVVSVEHIGKQDVYNGTVDEFHTLLAIGPGAEQDDRCSYVLNVQCGEILLEAPSYEVCNLNENYPTHHETLEDFLITLKHSYLYSKAVTLLPTPWAETNEVVGRNRRIGSSMTGIAEFVEERGWPEMRRWADEGYRAVQEYDRIYSEWLGVRESIKTTTVKPAGSTSILAACSPGVHWPVASGKFLRRQRLAKVDPLIPLYISAGYHVEPDVMDPDTTVVVTFPIQSKEMRSQGEVSVWEKASLAADMQRYWADNGVSVTLSFDPESEGEHLAALIQAYQGKLKGVSFLAMDNKSYEQQPFEVVSDEEFDKASAKLTGLDIESLYQVEKDAVGEAFCDGDACEISL